MLNVLDVFNLGIGEHTTIPTLSKKKSKPSGCGINNRLTFNVLVNQGKQKHFDRVERKPVDWETKTFLRDFRYWISQSLF